MKRWSVVGCVIQPCRYSISNSIAGGGVEQVQRPAFREAYEGPLTLEQVLGESRK